MHLSFSSRSVHNALAAASLTLAAALPAQASFTTFGTACQQGQAIGAANLPQLGQSFDVLYSGLIGNMFFGGTTQLSSPFLMVGLSNTQAGSTPLPFTLPTSVTSGIPNCEILVSPDAILALSPNAPFPFTLQLAIPANPAFVGTSLHLQWFTTVQRWALGGPTTIRMVTSDAATAVIGF